MRRLTRKTWPALFLAATLPVSGCSHTHLSGEYRPSPGTDIVHRNDERVIAEGSRWPFLWGLLDLGDFDLNLELQKAVRDSEAFTDLDIRERVSVGGVVLWILTVGIVSHHTVVVRGSPAELRHETPPAPAPSPGTPAPP
jgi:hypothetical protein